MGRPSIDDEFTRLPVSRQRRDQLRQRRDGKCARCGRPRNLYFVYCDECQAQQGGRKRRDPVARLTGAPAPVYTHCDAAGIRWRFVAGRPVSEPADLVMRANGLAVPASAQGREGRPKRPRNKLELLPLQVVDHFNPQALRRRRITLGLTMAEAARQLGVGLGTYRDWEYGAGRKMFGTLNRLMAWFGPNAF